MLLGVVLAVIGLMAMPMAAAADSLWSDRNVSPFSGKRIAYKAGDLLTVVIVESASATQKAESNNGESGSVSASGSGSMGKLLPALGTDWKSSSDGKGTTTRGGTITAKITVTVLEVNPEGLLTIEGRQMIKVNKEEQILKITGTVRPEDIASDNTIYSTYIANAAIEYQGSGTVGDTQGTGILTRIFHWIF
ncbi:flagellar L-ring protein precursor FlgH [Hydrogenispora ethanolica]|jgi:flagellar L-ring protein precursor FlgH|uniref:Flagellar L-ring protein FlgH n=2 Tax=Hydrogenispora ethanolica TaxID=1082276 RepID=A0A4R1S7G5_HYDET|nr:flagellar L-ring protein precursor FlgH [Hydrogenispora ethanolica]